MTLLSLSEIPEKARYSVAVSCGACGEPLVNIASTVKQDWICHAGITFASITVDPCPVCMQRATEQGERRYRPKSHLYQH